MQIELPKQLQNTDFRFIPLNAKSKVPIEKGWTDGKHYSYNDIEFENHLKQGGNYGILGAKGNLLIIDFDDLNFQHEFAPKLPETFTVKSGSGKMHKYFICDIPKTKAIRNEKGESLADILGAKKQAVAPGSIHPNGNAYEVLEDKPIAFIRWSYIEALFSHYLEKDKDHIKEKMLEDPIIASIKDKIDIKDLLSQYGYNTMNNPTMCQLGHPSKSQKCFSFTEENGLWKCFHCHKGGDVISLIMEHEKINFMQARKKAAELAGVSLMVNMEDSDAIAERLEMLKKIQKRHNKEITKTNSDSDYETAKRWMEEAYYNNNILSFLITKRAKKVGKVINKLHEYKKSLPLLKVGHKKIKTKEGEEELTRLFFLGEQIPRGWTIVSEFAKSFFLYDYVCNEKQYVLLSETQLECEEHVVNGMIVEVENINQISLDCRLAQKVPLLFINKIKTNKLSFKNKNECIEKAKELNLTRENFLDYLLSDEYYCYRQPEWYENLLTGFLFSARYKGYHMHFIVIGAPESGKTKHMLALYQKFEEHQAHTSGSSSTIKGLMPSFNSIPIKMGALIGATRFHAIDEFLRILSNTPDEVSRKFLLGKLNGLYDGLKERFESGNGFAEGEMKAKVMCVSNPSYGCSNLSSTFDWLDPPFLSRNLIYFQTPSHMAQIRLDHLLKEPGFRIKNKDFKAFFDYALSFRSEYDSERIKSLYTRLKQALDDGKKDISDNISAHLATRQIHHMHCMLDGLIKFRCFTEFDNSFTATEKDYQKLEEIWEVLVESWKDGIKK